MSEASGNSVSGVRGGVNHWVLRIGLPIALIVVGAAVYANSFSGAFVFDDEESVLENPNILHLWPISKAMSSPPQYTVAGRPVASLSLALNYAISGYEVWSYHLFNLLVHILAGLTLYGIIRRTLLCERLRERFGKHSAVLAWAATAIWVVHPLQTESVTYIVQRTESIMGLFYLLTLYSAIRAMQSDKPLIWPAVSVICCGLGMGTKEVMVTAPAMVLLYDRAFFAGSFGEAFRRRWGLYAGLAATWVVLLVLIHTAPRSHTAGFAFSYKPLDYAMNQCRVIVHYLRLSVWPRGLCLDYSWPVVKDFGRLLPLAAVIAAMVAAAIWGLVRNKAWSYPAAWFFVVLAPTSSFVPLMDVIFEHRMYLPLAGVVVPAVLTGYVLAVLPHRRSGLFEWLSARRLMVALAAAVIVVLGWGTFLRNNDYRSGESIWQKALDVVPNNVRAYYNLGLAMQKQGRLPEAIRNYNQAIRLNPDYYRAYYNLGHLMQSQGRLDEAIGYYQQVIAIKPDLAELSAEAVSAKADAYCNLGSVFASMGKLDEAISYYRQGLAIKPDDAEAYNNLGLAFLSAALSAEAVSAKAEASAKADSAQGRFDEAVSQFRRALEIWPDFAEAYYNLAITLKSQGKIEEAISSYRQAIRARPDYAQAHNNLGNLLKSQGKADEAASHYREAIRIQPDYYKAHNNLGIILKAQGRLDEAIMHYRLALRARPRPDYAEAHYNLGAALQAAGKTDEAMEHYKKAKEYSSAKPAEDK